MSQNSEEKVKYFKDGLEYLCKSFVDEKNQEQIKDVLKEKINPIETRSMSDIESFIVSGWRKKVLEYIFCRGCTHQEAVTYFVVACKSGQNEIALDILEYLLKTFKLTKNQARCVVVDIASTTNISSSQMFELIEKYGTD